MPPTQTVDGAVRFLQLVATLAAMVDGKSSGRGIGLRLYLGVVMSPYPDITVKLENITDVAGPSLRLSSAKGDLLIPQGLLLTKGDTIVLAPVFGGKRWFVVDKLRSPEIEDELANSMLLGYNGHRTTGSFKGVSIRRDTSTGEVSVHVVADHITLEASDSITLEADTVVIDSPDITIAGADIDLNGTVKINGVTQVGD